MVKCEVCSREFKNKAGLVGHQRFSHSIAKVKTYPDDIGKRLENLESRVGGLITGKKFEEAMKVVREDFKRLYDFTGLLPHEGQLEEIVEKGIRKAAKKGFWVGTPLISFRAPKVTEDWLEKQKVKSKK